MGNIILGIESSCDDTSAAVLDNEVLLSNVIASQKVHEEFGGVVPELASRAHQQNIVPVVDAALKQAGKSPGDIDAIAFTRGPGLLGSLLVGTSFTKGFASALNIPMVEVNHLQGHILSLFIKESRDENQQPVFPFLCLLVSGGHSQIIVIKSHYDMEIIGETIDDAAGEAFDKCAKVIGLPYPGGPVVDEYAKLGDASKISLNKPKIPGLNYSFSGLKTSFLYHIRDEIKLNPAYIDENIYHLCASLQETIIDILMAKLKKAAKQTGIKNIGLAGGVSANSGLRSAMEAEAKKRKWNLYLPQKKFTTDNAAMIAIAGYYKYLKKDFAPWDIAPMARMNF